MFYVQYFEYSFVLSNENINFSRKLDIAVFYTNI